MTIQLGRRFLVGLAVAAAGGALFAAGYFTGAAAAPSLTVSSSPPTTSACIVQPVADVGNNDVVEIRGIHADAYCSGLGGQYQASPKPASATPVCTLSRLDVGQAIVWDTGFQLLGTQLCSSLKSSGWAGGS